IVAFAEVEKFIDIPVKRYSSGMYLRLAFAAAAHLSTDILLLDEVLTVGDNFFQAKALERIQKLASGGKTVLFVSHHLDTVGKLCQRTCWLNNGMVKSIGPTQEIVSEYLLDMRKRAGVDHLRLPGGGALVRLLDARLEGRVHYGEPITYV